MRVGGLCKRASQRAAKRSTAALQRDGIVAVFPAVIAESADRWINGAFCDSLHSSEQLLLRRQSEARRHSVRPREKTDCEACPTSSRTTSFKDLEEQVLTARGVVSRDDYCCYSSRCSWGSLPRRHHFHTEGGAAAAGGLESSSLLRSADDRMVSRDADIRNCTPSSEEGLERTTVINVENQAAANECEEISEERKHVVVHLLPKTANQSMLGPFQTVDLPKIENPTAKVINRVCSILDVQEWGSETLKTLEDANLVITPFLIQQIIQRISSKNVNLTLSFFKWAREKAGGKISMRAHIAILDALGRSEEFETMKEAFGLVLEDGHREDPWPYNNALKWCCAAENVEAALYFWSKMEANNCKPTVVTYTRLIDLLARQGFHEESLEFFRQMLKANCPPNISTYNVLIHAFGVAGKPDVAESLFDRLPELGCKPNYSTFNTLISLHVGAGKPERALKYFNMMKAAGMDIGDDVCRTLNLSLPRVRDVPEEMASQETIDSFGTQDQSTAFVSHPGLLSSFPGRIIRPRSFVKLLETGEPLSVEAKLEKIKPLIHSRFVVQVLQRIKNPDTALIFFDWAKDQPHFKHTAYSYCTMITILRRSRSNEALDRIMKDIQEQGIFLTTPIFTELITAYGRANDMDGALKVFQLMKECGCKPDVVTYTSLIHLLAKHGSHEPAVNMFEEMKLAGIAPNAHTYSVMIYNHIKAGRVTEAVSLLNGMPGLSCQPSPITFATIIDHCAKEGQLEIAKNLFSQMEAQGIKPLKTTITVLGAAFRRAGMTEDADRVMEKSRSMRFWDENFKSSTEKVAHELLLKDFAKRDSSRHSASVQF